MAAGAFEHAVHVRTPPFDPPLPQANELSISLLAAVPAFLIAGTSLFYLGRWAGGCPVGPPQSGSGHDLCSQVIATSEGVLGGTPRYRLKGNQRLTGCVSLVPPLCC